MVYNGVKFTVEEGGDGIWRWRYIIASLIKTGELSASSCTIAVRKVRQKIDRDLRNLYLSQRERGIQI